MMHKLSYIGFLCCAAAVIIVYYRSATKAVEKMDEDIEAFMRYFIPSNTVVVDSTIEEVYDYPQVLKEVEHSTYE